MIIHTLIYKTLQILQRTFPVLTDFKYNLSIDTLDDAASINVTAGRDSWDKSVGRPTIEKAVEEFWNENYVLSYVHLTASRRVYKLLQSLSEKCGCVVRVS